MKGYTKGYAKDRGPCYNSLSQAVQDRTATIAVVGIGYVGLPLAVAFAEKGFHVIGVDTNRERVAAVATGRSYVEDVPDERLRAVRENLMATTVQDALTDADVILVCVPTPLTRTKDPDLTHIRHEAEEIALRLRRGQLVVLESTTYPGTTRGVVLPILQKRGLRLGKDYFLAYSPEMVDPGNRRFGLHNTPKIVGGIDDASMELAVAVYGNVAEMVVPVRSPEVAEMAKVFSNVFRLVNIALANEMAQLCDSMGVSVWEMLHAVSMKPFGYMPFFPGPGVGGHCIPCDPYYLSCKAREHDFHTRFIELAAEINERMPYYVAGQVGGALNARGIPLRGSRVLVMGMSYKRGVTDTRESPSMKLFQLLKEQGAVVGYHDPLVRVAYSPDGPVPRSELSPDYTELDEYDCVVLTVDHDEYVRDRDIISFRSRLLYDAKGMTHGMESGNIVRLGEGIK